MSGSENERSSSSSCHQNKMRKRSANFTPNETILLMSLISDFKNIIENKKTDGVSVQEKNLTWKKITAAFNSQCPESRHRSMESLKKLYENKKRDTRKAKAEERKEILLTGGGIPKKIVKDPTQDLVLSIVDPLTVVGGASFYGSDSMPLPKPNTTQNDDYFAFELENDEIDGDNVIIINEMKQPRKGKEQGLDQPEQTSKDSLSYDWKKGADLLRPISSPLKRPREETAPHVNNISNNNMRPLNRRRPTETVVRSLTSNQLAEKYNQLADKKNMIADFVLKKLKLDIQHSTEEHDLRMQALKLDIEKKKKEI